MFILSGHFESALIKSVQILLVCTIWLAKGPNQKTGFREKKPQGMVSIVLHLGCIKEGWGVLAKYAVFWCVTFLRPYSLQ